MGVVHGYTLQYNKWKENMIKVTQVNPPTEGRQLANGSILLNETILGHLKAEGIDLHKIGSLIPARPDARPEYLATLYGEKIYVDHVGRLKFGVRNTNTNGHTVITFSDGEVNDSVITFRAAEKIETGQMVAIVEPECSHGFVVRDVVGDDRFLCKECDVRFPRHPSMMPKEPKFNSPSMSIGNNLHNTAILTEFHDGLITFSAAAQATQFSLAEMKRAMEELFPQEMISEDIYTVGSLVPKVMYFSEKPKRVTCFKEVEDIFGNPNVTIEDFNKILTTGCFPDLTHIDEGTDLNTGKLVMKLNFVDGSIQRIELDVITTAFTKPYFKSQAHADHILRDNAARLGLGRK